LPSPVYPDDSNEESFDKLEELEPQALHQRWLSFITTFVFQFIPLKLVFLVSH
jgi:hypothetical protein